MAIKYRQIEFGNSGYYAGVRIREKMLREPLGLALSPDDTADDANQVHIGAFFNQTLVACVSSVKVRADVMKLRQMAVLVEYQNRGIGRDLIAYAESLARDHGATMIEMHARVSAASFYKKSGYLIVGQPFEEVTIPHIRMTKSLL